MRQQLHRIITGSLFAGLEIQFLAGGIAVHFILLKQKGIHLVIEKFIANVESIEKLSYHLPKNVPLAVCFTGKGVLHKRVACDPDADAKVFLSKIFPNALLKDFYVQSVPAVHDEQFISVVRKESVDLVLEQLKAKKFSIVECSLGPFAVLNILPLLGKIDNEIKFAHHSILFNDALAEGINFSEEISDENKFTIGTQQIPSETLLAFAVAFQQLFSSSKKADAKIESIAFVKEEFFRNRKFKTGGVGLLLCTFILLIINYFVFSHYWNKKNELENKFQTDGGALAKVRELEKKVESKRSFLEQAGLLGASHNSFYADQVAAELPNEILLSELNIAPRLKISQEDSIGFTPGKIEIDGSCSKSVVLNSWMQKLKTKPWVKNIFLESYSQDKTMKDGEFAVSVELK